MLRSDEDTIKLMVQIIGQHVYDFARIEKNIRDTSLPKTGELYTRMSELYIRYGIYQSHPVIL